MTDFETRLHAMIVGAQNSHERNLFLNVRNLYDASAKFALLAERAEHAETLQKLARILPQTYYADRPLQFRLQEMVGEWRRAIEVNQSLEAERTGKIHAS